MRFYAMTNDGRFRRLSKATVAVVVISDEGEPVAHQFLYDCQRAVSVKPGAYIDHPDIRKVTQQHKRYQGASHART